MNKKNDILCRGMKDYLISMEINCYMKKSRTKCRGERLAC